MIPLKDTIPSKRKPIMTLTLILISTILFVIQLRYNSIAMNQFGLIPLKIYRIQNLQSLLSFISFNFLHGGWIHLIGNMWALWLFGDNVEDRMGPVRFLLFYLSCGIIAGIVHVISNLSSAVPTIGASGAIAGIMGAYFIMYPKSRIITLIPIFFIPLFIEIPAIIYLAFWLLSQVYALLIGPVSGTFSNIAWSAHIGGFIAGMILHRLYYAPTWRRYQY